MSKFNFYSSSTLNQVRAHIKSGGIIAYPTESCYGFGCDIHNYKAIRTIMQLKNRFKRKGMIIVAGNFAQIAHLVNYDDEYFNYWPGFYTLVLPVMGQIPKTIITNNTIAVRISAHPLIKQLCRFLNMPLISTSANKSGSQSLKSALEVKRIFGNKVMILDGLTQGCKKPSTIIRWSDKAILR